MSAIRDIAEFRSPRFTPVLPEASQVNPGCYGAELAFWHCTCLFVQGGIATSYPVAEGWGWFLDYATGAGDEFALHCGNIDGEDDRWLLTLRRFGRKLFGRDEPDFERASPLIDALATLLRSEASITEID